MAGRRSPLFDEHADHGGTLGEFGGWEVPIEFDSIVAEHRTVRESAGKFDISHMGEIEVTGPDAGTLMQRLLTNDVLGLESGQARYSAVTNDEGIMLDDTVVYRLPDTADTHDDDTLDADTHDADIDGPTYLFVPNAGHDAEMYDRWTAYREEWDLAADVRNATEEYAMIALQGPDAVDLLGARTGEPVADLGRFRAMYATVAGVECLVSRTGYTGEDGFELLVPWDDATAVWSAFDCQPCGLGARDTLRLEAGLLLSGQDFDPDEEPRTPYEAGIGFTVDLDDEFVGRDALERKREAGFEETLVGFRLLERGVPRHGYDLTDPDGTVVGKVTSGTMSPSLDVPIGMGYVPVDRSDPGTRLGVDIRGQQKGARVETLPFYERE